jgi:sulfur carrier protein ThiS
MVVIVERQVNVKAGLSLEAILAKKNYNKEAVSLL